MVFLASCGTPSPPTPPRPPIPVPVTDLAARQIGDKVQLSFTLPKETTEGIPLEQPPDIEIYRGYLSASAQAAGSAAKTTLTYTLPSAVVDTYLAEGRVEFDDPFTRQDWSQHAGESRVYAVKTRASKHRDSEFSNVVSVRPLPVPEPSKNVIATLTEPAVELKWTPPSRTSAGQSFAEAGVSIGGFRIYRTLLPRTGDQSTETSPEFLAVSPVPNYRDVQFEFGRTYIYRVTSVAQFGADSVESDYSAPITVEAHDTFPPAVPQNLVVVLVPATESAAAHFELSWAISQETDLAGYYVYRSEGDDTSVQKISGEMLPVPTFRDTTVRPGKRYTYSVTAVDRTGNESLRSAPVSEIVPEAKRP